MIDSESTADRVTNNGFKAAAFMAILSAIDFKMELSAIGTVALIATRHTVFPKLGLTELWT